MRPENKEVRSPNKGFLTSLLFYNTRYEWENIK